MVALTRGGDGALICQGQDRAMIPFLWAYWGDTVGAGDTFGAALLSILDAGRFAGFGPLCRRRRVFKLPASGLPPPHGQGALAFLQENS